MTRTVLAFGDSNTHGTPPMTSFDHHPRLARRWPVVMAEAMGCTLIEEGLPGRTMCALSSALADNHFDGLIGLRIALASHGPIDDLVILLSSNDMQARYGRTPEMVLGGLAALLEHAFAEETQARHGGFRTTVICPPPIRERGTFVPGLWGGEGKSKALPELMRPLAEAWGASFMDAGAHIESCDEDGVHFTSDAHQTLGHAVAAHLQV